MMKLTCILNRQKIFSAKRIAKMLIVSLLLLCVSAGLADEMNEYLVYPWDVYQAMSMEDKAAFIENFDELQDFDNWAYLACLFSQSIAEEDRALLKYTWAEFDSMMPEDQQAFCETLGDYVFEAWMSVAQRNTLLAPLYTINPQRCAWADFETMEVFQKEALFERFGNAEDFEAWMAKAQETPLLSPALVDDYRNCTWAEFSVMTDAQKDAFFELFEDGVDFEAWMGAAQKMVKKAKPNLNMTWAELEAMDIAEKEAFFESFESAAAFEAWMEQAKKRSE